jgi:hypothetical protein
MAPTIQPSPAPTTSSHPTMTSTYEITPEPSYMPTTASPTITPPPTVSPTGPPKEASETEVNLVFTMKNTLNRNMTSDEEKSFKEYLLPFLKKGLSLEGDGVRVDKLDVWYQEQVEWSRRKLRDLQENQLASTAITVILGVAYYESEDEDVSDVIVNFVEKAEVSIINLFRGNDENLCLYPIDALKVKAIDQVTLSSVAAPVSVDEQTVTQTQRSADNDADAGSAAGSKQCLIFIASTVFECQLSPLFQYTQLTLALVLVLWQLASLLSARLSTSSRNASVQNQPR